MDHASEGNSLKKVEQEKRAWAHKDFCRAELGFQDGTSGKEPTFQCRRCKRRTFDPWVGKVPWKRAWQPTPVFLPGEPPWTEEPGGLQTTGLQSWT